MNNPLVPAVLLAIVVLVLVVLQVRRIRDPRDEEWPFYAKKPLTAPEQVLYHRLVKALPEHIVLAQVQVSRVLGVKKGFNFHQWNNRVNRLSYDFVICSKDARALAAIELDDKSHDSAERADTDRKKERATAAAGLRLVRLRVNQLPDVHAIAQMFSEPPSAGGRIEPTL